MWGPPRVRSMNVSDSDSRPVLVPAGNKAHTTDVRKASSKPMKKQEENNEVKEEKNKQSLNSNSQCVLLPKKILKHQDHCHHHDLHHGVFNLSMNASCSSEASTATTDSSTSSGRLVKPVKKKNNGGLKVGNDNVGVNDGNVVVVESCGGLEGKKRCAWITTNTESNYVAFHDEEWGVPVHDDKKLFELLSLSGALAELQWPAILSKRQLFREVFLEFDPSAVSRMNEKKITAPGSPATSLLSELRLRAIIENARQICKVTEEFGSFDTFIWNFVNHKAIVSQFRYPRQVPVKSPKAEFISKDLVKRGFRSVGPTVIYTFMQVAGLTNDHLITCFRFKECSATQEVAQKDGSLVLSNNKVKDKKNEDPTEVGLLLAVD